MRYVVYGAGAVGTLIGSRLALAGHDVNFLTRPHLVDEFREHGLRLTGDTEPDFLQTPNLSTTFQAALSSTPADVILLTVKAFDSRAAGEDILDHALTDVPLVSFANGISNEKTLGEILGTDRIIPATLTTSVQLFLEGEIRVEHERGIGLAGSHPLIPRISMEMTSSGMVVRQYADPDRMKWSKALVNIISNASSAILGWSPAQIFQHPGLFRLELEALRETVRIMRRMGNRPQNLPGAPISLLGYGIFLPPVLIQKILGRIVAKSRGEKRPSFHFDIGRGRSEVHWLNGAISSTGSELGIPTPANTVLFETMKALVNRAQEHERYLDKPDQLLSLAAKAGVPGFQGYNPSRD